MFISDGYVSGLEMRILLLRRALSIMRKQVRCLKTVILELKKEKTRLNQLVYRHETFKF